MAEKKLSQWEPLDDNALERHRIDSQRYMRSAVNANRQTDNILANIMEISDKMQRARQEMLNGPAGNYPGGRGLCVCVCVTAIIAWWGYGVSALRG